MFAAGLPHWNRNETDSTARSLQAMTPPSF
jgi:hypothetical protein